MKTIELTNASPDIASLLDQARVDDIVVRMADGSEFLLVAVDDFDREIARTRANPRLMALLESRADKPQPYPWRKRSEDWDCRVGPSKRCPEPKTVFFDLMCPKSVPDTLSASDTLSVRDSPLATRHSSPSPKTSVMRGLT